MTEQQQPHEDPTLPPQLREALRIMARRGPVVELTQPAAPEPDYDHYEDCPAHPDYKFAPEPCRCAAINAEEEAYYAEPRNMAELENGGGTPVW